MVRTPGDTPSVVQQRLWSDNVGREAGDRTGAPSVSGDRSPFFREISRDSRAITPLVFSARESGSEREI